MSQGDLVKITYGDRTFFVDEAAAETASRIADRMDRGYGAITFDHQAGRSTIAVGSGIPLTIDYFDGEPSQVF